MTKILLPAAPGTLTFSGFGVGFPGTHNTAVDAGSGFISIVREIYYLKGIVNNAGFTSSGVFWTIESAGLSLPWNQPFAYTFFLVLNRIQENRSAVCHGMLGGLPGTNSMLDFNQWRLDTARKRVGIIVERDAAGTIIWYLSWSNGVVQDAITMLAIPDLSWVTIKYLPSPRSAEVYVNGNLHARREISTLPSGTQTDGNIFHFEVMKVIAGAGEVSFRHWAPTILPLRT